MFDSVQEYVLGKARIRHCHKYTKYHEYNYYNHRYRSDTEKIYLHIYLSFNHVNKGFRLLVADVVN